MAGLAQTFQVLGTAVAAYLLARLMRRRGRRVGLVDRLPARAGRRRAGGASPGSSARWPCCSLGALLLGATTAVNNGVALRRHRPGDRGATGPGRCRSWCGRPPSAPSPGPTSPASAGLAALLGVPELTGASPSAPSACSSRPRRGRGGGCVPTRCSLAQEAAGSSPRRRPSRAAGRGAAFVAVVRDGAGGRGGRGRDGLRPRGDGDGDDHDAAAHGARRRAARGHRVRDQRPRARHVRLLAGGRAGPPTGSGARPCWSPGEWSCWSSLALCGLSPEGASWQIFAGLFLLGLGWSLRDGRRLDRDRRPRAARRPHRRAGRLRPGDGADRGAAAARSPGSSSASWATPRWRRLRRPAGGCGRGRRSRHPPALLTCSSHPGSSGLDTPVSERASNTCSG